MFRRHEYRVRIHLIQTGNVGNHRRLTPSLERIRIRKDKQAIQCVSQLYTETPINFYCV